MMLGERLRRLRRWIHLRTGGSWAHPRPRRASWARVSYLDERIRSGKVTTEDITRGIQWPNHP